MAVLYHAALRTW